MHWMRELPASNATRVLLISYLKATRADGNLIRCKLENNSACGYSSARDRQNLTTTTFKPFIFKEE
jgi:hypothetical protein